MRTTLRHLLVFVSTVCVSAACLQAPPAPQDAAKAKRSKAQTRPHGELVAVDVATVKVDDGDTVEIQWPGGDTEKVRILGIDSPETRHDEHNIPQDQPYGKEARAFARGAFAAATQIELLRAGTVDPYDRTLAYVFINKKNYSLMIIGNRLAYETVSHYGDNGFPQEAAQVLEAARTVGRLPFDPPYVFRRQMRELMEAKRAQGGEPGK